MKLEELLQQANDNNTIYIRRVDLDKQLVYIKVERDAVYYAVEFKKFFPTLAKSIAGNDNGNNFVFSNIFSCQFSNIEDNLTPISNIEMKNIEEEKREE